MTPKSASHFLSSFCKKKKEAELLVDELISLNGLKTKCQEVHLRGAAANLNAQCKRITAVINEYYQMMSFFNHTLNKMKENDVELQILLHKRYFENKKWEQIAEEMNYSCSHIFRLKKQAIFIFSLIATENNKRHEKTRIVYNRKNPNKIKIKKEMAF